MNTPMYKIELNLSSNELNLLREALSLAVDHHDSMPSVWDPLRVKARMLIDLDIDIGTQAEMQR